MATDLEFMEFLAGSTVRDYGNYRLARRFEN